jgi:hypothetical protein
LRKITKQKKGKSGDGSNVSTLNHNNELIKNLLYNIFIQTKTNTIFLSLLKQIDIFTVNTLRDKAYKLVYPLLYVQILINDRKKLVREKKRR